MKTKNNHSRISEADKSCVSSGQLTCWVCCTLSQFSHSKRLPLSCDIWWRMRLDFQLKALGHWSHLYSLSSVWTIMCCPRLDKENTGSLVYVEVIKATTLAGGNVYDLMGSEVFCVPVLIWKDLFTVFTLVDGLIAVIAFLFEVFSQCVKNGARAGARVLLVSSQLKCWGEQLITVFTAVHVLVYTHR